MTQYAAAKTADIDPDSALRVRLGALVIERSSWVSDKKQLIVVFLKRRRQSKESVEPQTCEEDNRRLCDPTGK